MSLKWAGVSGMCPHGEYVGRPCHKCEIRRLTAIINRQAKALALMGQPRCENLHHQKHEQHKGYESCPVEGRIEALLTPIAAEAAGGNDE